LAAILLVINDGENFSLDTIWLLPLLGLVLSGPGVFDWSLPRRWHWPLITWAMIVSIAWPIVFLREADFALWILPLPRVSNTSIGIGPWEVGLNVTYIALAHNAGILFVDALCRWFSRDRDRFRRELLAPFAVAWAIACAVAFYQGFVDLSFLNRPFWTYMIRASGTLADPNKLGAVTAFWTIGVVAIARRMTRPWSTAITVAALAIGIGAVWLCGSRTGLAAVAVSVAIAAWEALAHWRSTRSSAPINVTRVLVMGAAAMLIAVAMVALLKNASTHTVIARGSWTYIPFYGDKGIKASVNELLWERFGYGPAAIEMIKEHPIDGIGVGTFHALSTDFGKVAGYTIPQADNAQNWWRHHLAELGLVGSLPLLAWCWVCGALMFARRRAGDRLSIGLLRGVLIGFAVASMFGMPAQSIAIVMTFWTFAFWLWLEQMPASDAPPAWEWPKKSLIAAAVLIAVHAGMTTADALGDLRPYNRAQRWDWYYRYGFHTNDNDGTDLEPDPGGNPIGRRWTMKDSLAVIKVKGRVLKFVAWIDHPDADAKPVHARVWADSKLVYEGDLTRAPLMLDIPATPDKMHMVIETSVDRTWRPSDSATGSRDTRDLGLSIRDWTWQ
jgi:O-antigen ligase